MVALDRHPVLQASGKCSQAILALQFYGQYIRFAVRENVCAAGPMQIPTLGHCFGSILDLALTGGLNRCVCIASGKVPPSASI